MYTNINFKTKKAFREYVARYLEGQLLVQSGLIKPRPITLWAPGLGTPATNGREFVEGPHFPEPHKWYAEVVVKDGIVVSVK